MTPEQARELFQKHRQYGDMANYGEKAAVAAIMEAVEHAALVAQCAFDDRPRSRCGHYSETDWSDGYLDGTRAAAAAIRGGVA